MNAMKTMFLNEEHKVKNSPIFLLPFSHMHTTELNPFDVKWQTFIKVN